MTRCRRGRVHTELLGKRWQRRRSLYTSRWKRLRGRVRSSGNIYDEICIYSDLYLYRCRIGAAVCAVWFWWKYKPAEHWFRGEYILVCSSIGQNLWRIEFARRQTVRRTIRRFFPDECFHRLLQKRCKRVPGWWGCRESNGHGASRCSGRRIIPRARRAGWNSGRRGCPGFWGRSRKGTGTRSWLRSRRGR